MNAVLPVVPIAEAGVVLQRARGRAHVGFKRAADGSTRLKDLWQEGSAKIRLPNTYSGEAPVAVFINTAGGVTGGDHILLSADFAEGTRATVTTQACERIYRRSEGVGRIDNRLTLGPGAEAAWLPQETIVFDGAGLDRSLSVDLAGTARLVAVEAVVLGRTAMGEDVRTVRLADRWTVRREGRLVYADALRLAGDTRAILSGGATGRGARAFATVLVVDPEADAALEPVRACLDGIEGVEAGASAFDGLLAVRLLANDGRALRRVLEPLLTTLVRGPLPRVWSL